MNEAANLDATHGHLAQAIDKLGAMMDGGGTVSLELLEIARHLSEAQSHLSDLSHSLRPFLARLALG